VRDESFDDREIPREQPLGLRGREIVGVRERRNLPTNRARVECAIEPRHAFKQGRECWR